MRVLFSALTPAFVKNFDSVIRALSDREHEVELAVHDAATTPDGDELVRALASEPGVSLVEAPPVELSAPLLERVTGIRSSLDYLRFLEPRFSGASLYTSRAKNVPGRTRRAAELPLLRTAAGRRLLRRIVLATDARIPPNPASIRFLEERRPDVVLATPYVVRWDHDQPELIRAAQHLRMPTGVCIGSWDHLTTKSSICPQPDRVFVWNEIQRREAHQLHGVPADRIVVTGAQCFDDWFSRKPTPREEFCARAGLDPGRPYLLYACSAPLKRRSPPEVSFVLEWLDAVRTGDDPRLASVGVLLRPHPKRTEIWEGVDLSGYDDVVVFPREPGFPTSSEAKRDYFDSIYHSAAVVGLNTSAMLESGIVGRPVLTILSEELRASQTDLIHFGYLREVGGGLIHVAGSLEEHLAMLRRALDDGGAGSRANETFIREFLRPRGLDREATPIFVDEVEKLASRAGEQPRVRRRPLVPVGGHGDATRG
jgi:hypothetical protein